MRAPSRPLASWPGGFASDAGHQRGAGGDVAAVSTGVATAAGRGAVVSLPGTCGELVQGTYDGVYCLVSCPIDRYSTAAVSPRAEAGLAAPAGAAKAAAALRHMLTLTGQEGSGLALTLDSPLPRSRGYGSSTADVGAALYAAAECLSLALCPQAAARIAVSVEPSDSTLLPGLSLLDHCGATRAEFVAPAPPIAVLVLDPGDEVDTLAFNAVDRGHDLARLTAVHQEAMSLLLHGLRGGDPAAVGEAATLSARAHQAVLANPLLDVALALAESLGALGLCRAHSGTILGIMLDPEGADLVDATAYARRRLAGAADVSLARLVDGGPRHGREAPATAPHLTVPARLTPPE